MKGILKSILPLTLAVFAILIVTSVSASAQTGRHCRKGNINARQENQHREQHELSDQRSQTHEGDLDKRPHGQRWRNQVPVTQR